MIPDKNTILETLGEISPVLREKYGVTRIGIFGSVARNQGGPDSDVDIVVEMHPDLLKRALLKEDLESLLGHKVDVVRYRPGMNKFLKKRIDNEGHYV
ncbi:MAG: nucleotidyltransferase family protein [Desulfobacteraceae bacterium]|nr:nucleotidyltransferase family protein [Desulfobacteraceae bacterium]MBU4053032.1 nucleotidyltransferase family protein [Pseudomonadota bacterium]